MSTIVSDTNTIVSDTNSPLPASDPGTDSGYRGENRRGRWIEPRPSLPGKQAMLQAGAMVFGALVPVGFALGRGMSIAPAADLLRLLGAILAVGAGVSALTCWKVVGLARFGWWGCALTVFGLLDLANASLPALGAGQLSGEEPLGRLVIDLIVMGIIFRALRSPEVDSRLVPLRLTVAATLLGLVVLGVLSLMSRRGDLPLAFFGDAGQAVIKGLMAGGWAGLVGIALLRRPYGQQMSWTIPVMLLFAVAEVTSAARSAGDTSWMFAAAVVSVVAMAFACSECGSDLAHVLRGQDRQSRRLRMDLDAARRDISIERAHLDERLHDLRNAIAAVRSADSTLRSYQGRLDAETRTSLADSISSELGRLQMLIEPGAPRQSVDFLLSEAIMPVVVAERSLGTDIRVHVGELRARGDEDALAQVVQNLLANARRHASGTPVEITAIQLADRLELRVRDYGDGVAEMEQEAIFGRGVRGVRSEKTPGSGLGLHVAAQLLADMGGSIRLRGVDGPGACFSVELPAARAHRLAQR